eukprot:SAG31_NODE_1844_length_7106_cov_3.064935_1_plen_101_part_00
MVASDALPPNSWSYYGRGKENLFTFPYDWRRDYGETAELLADVVGQVSTQCSGEKIMIVAHGAGGLLAFAALAEVSVHRHHTASAAPQFILAGNQRLLSC